MGLVEDITAQIDVVSSKLDGIAGEVSALQAQVAAGSPASVEQLQGILDSLKTVATREDAVLAPVPTPPVE